MTPAKPPQPQDPNAIERMLDRSEAAVGVIRRFFASYFWLILKNVVGWLLILLSIPAGIFLPGPGGLPMFLIGFALVFFPGKRRITSHVLRGRPLQIEASIFTSITTICSLIVISVLLWIVRDRYVQLIEYFGLDPKRGTRGFLAAVTGACVLAALVTWGVMWLLLRFANLFIRLVPFIRRKIRPWMRRWGIVLLPPKRRHTAGTESGAEILEISLTARQRLARWWQASRPWARRFIGLTITAALVYWLIEPIIAKWRAVEPFVNTVRPISFVAAVSIFAGSLFVFRITTWWLVLRKMGHKLPLSPVMRIWSTSEVVRYLPAHVWQTVGRPALCKPYGVSATTATASHTIELFLFVLANVVVAVAALAWWTVHYVQGDAKWWLASLIALAPLLLLLHPRTFYVIANRLLKAIRQPPIETRVSGPVLLGLLMWNVVGVVAMSMGIWLIASVPLQFPLAKWWIVGCAYCLAWLAGFVSYWAPAGVGVREIIFMAVVLLLIPVNIRLAIGNDDGIDGFVALLALVLRVGTVAGEIIVLMLAYALDAHTALVPVPEPRRIATTPTPAGSDPTPQESA